MRRCLAILSPICAPFLASLSTRARWEGVPLYPLLAAMEAKTLRGGWSYKVSSLTTFLEGSM